ncbi:MAG: hypothetical protein ACTHKQ_25950 [Mesorhizobium sp.]
MTNSHDTTPANPIPPGWPDPLESPQAEAIRNGKLDDTEIRNLFDCMERELRLHRERAANPAQWVSEKLDNLSPAESIGAFDGSGQWIEVCTVAEFRQSVSEANRVADALEACDWSGPSIGNKATLQKAVELLRSAAMGAGGQPVAHQWRKRDRVMKHDENWSYVDYHTGLKIAEYPDKYEVRPLYTHPAPSGQAVAEGLHLTEYEIQVLLGTSIHGCNMSPDRVFSLDMAWHRLHALDLIDRTDGLAIVTEKGERVIATILSAIAHPVQPVWRECATDGCVSPATIHFVRGGVGSYYCYSCYCKIQALPAAPKGE